MDKLIFFFEHLFILMEKVYVKMEPYWVELTLVLLFFIVAYITDRNADNKTA
ncbi:hypothetical protein [Brevibacillus sp. SYSU BS000544]|uniref:hypothetical protein n=1 Tax=Brevibacillus sp. SYSU BS000544 TaxID=3416443 RepID=UPI003CE5B634